jgi:hypothetical protein
MKFRELTIIPSVASAYARNFPEKNTSIWENEAKKTVPKPQSNHKWR